MLEKKEILEVENASTEIANDIGAWPCPFCDKSDRKSKAGLANHILDLNIINFFD